MTVNKYLLKAVDAYPYDLESTLESLEYALSYNAEDVNALVLMGRFYSEQFQDYETAKMYFQDALAVNVYALNVHMHYLDVLLWNGDFDEAQKFIEFLKNVKGIGVAELYLKQAYVYEYQFKYKKAMKALIHSKKHAMNNSFIQTLEQQEKRVKEKIAANRKK